MLNGSVVINLLQLVHYHSKASLQGLEQHIEQLDLHLSHTWKDDEELWN